MKTNSRLYGRLSLIEDCVFADWFYGKAGYYARMGIACYYGSKWSHKIDWLSGSRVDYLVKQLLGLHVNGKLQGCIVGQRFIVAIDIIWW